MTIEEANRLHELAAYNYQDPCSCDQHGYQCEGCRDIDERTRLAAQVLQHRLTPEKE